MLKYYLFEEVLLLKKIDYAIKNLNLIKSLLICPICSNNLIVKNNSLVCSNNHTFNISKKGTVILYKTSKIKKNKIYNNKLFENRIKFINAGYYDKLYKELVNIIKQYKIKIVLDMGSGDGTHDINILKELNDRNIFIIGADLSKAGVDLSNNYVDNNFIGIMADLNYLPLKDKSIDLILNILSPSNEEEMNRIIKKDGLVIKVTPKTEYLKELRTALGIKDYENESIIDKNIRQKYIVVDKKEIIDTYQIANEQINYLFNMTPLTNNIRKIPKIKFITIALNIYILKVKNDE